MTFAPQPSRGGEVAGRLAGKCIDFVRSIVKQVVKTN